MKLRLCAYLAISLLVVLVSAAAQDSTTNSQAGLNVVPHLIKFSGLAKDETGKPISGTLGVTFALYKDEQGGAPLWLETQNVQADANGNYTVMLGATRPDGLPLDLFTSGEARWLGVRTAELEQPRILLVSVPYAIKAHEAETLAGRSISDFVLNESRPGTTVIAPSGTVSATGHSSTSSAAPPPPAGPTTFSGSNATQIVGVTQSGTGTGLSATSTTHSAVAGTITGPTNTGVYGLASNTATGSTAAGVTGLSNTQLGPGVQGSTSSSKGLGVQGVVNATSGGIAVQGLNKATTGISFGVQGQTSSVTTNSSGVSGFEAAKTGQVYGVSGGTDSTTNGAAAVDGFEGAATGQVYGVSGGTNSTTQYAAGVTGYENAATGQVFGVSGTASSSTTNAMGVAGNESATKGQVYGVDGYTASTGPSAAGVGGFEGAATGQVYGVTGGAKSTTNFSAGVSGFESATTGQVFGVNGGTNSTTNGSAGVAGNENAATGAVYGVYGGAVSTTTNAMGVSGYEGAKTGQVYGVNGNTGSVGPGAAAVNGYEGATTGQVSGVSGSTPSTSGTGVNGNASATTGNTSGVFGTVNSPNGNGVYGLNNSSGSSLLGNGVFGLSTAGTGASWGVKGASNSTNGVGVEGYSFAVGVRGQGLFCGSSGCVPEAADAGQFITASGGNILHGFLNTAGTWTEKFRVDSSGNGYFAGNLNVTGKLTKGSGSFKIDHPLDPANKYLSHSFVESPDMMNIYNGNVTTDKHGLATIVLPDYFEALNRDFRYQLTVIGEFAQAIVAKKVANNRFVIRINKPHVEVSWQVTGIRHDAYANAYRIPIEEIKPANEQGHYLHPELFGASDKDAIGAVLPGPSGASK